MSVYTWNGNGSDNYWNNPNNWDKQGGGTGYPGLSNNDEAHILINADIEVPLYINNNNEIEIQIDGNVNLAINNSQFYVKKLVCLGGFINLQGSTNLLIFRNINTQNSSRLSIYQDLGGSFELLEIYDDSEVTFDQINNANILQIHETARLYCNNTLTIKNYFEISPHLNGGGIIYGNFNLNNSLQINRLDSIVNISTNFNLRYINGVFNGIVNKIGDGILTIKNGNIILDKNFNLNGGSIDTINDCIIGSTNDSYLIVNIGTTLQGYGTIDNLNINGGTFKPLLYNSKSGSQYVIKKDLVIVDYSNLIFTIFDVPFEGIGGKDNNNICPIYIENTNNISNKINFEIQINNLSISDIEKNPDYYWNIIYSYPPNNFIYTGYNSIIYPSGFTEAKWSIYQSDHMLVLQYQDNINPLCLTENTKILTPNGYISIDKLKKGDYIITDDNRKVQIKKIYMTEFKPNKKTLPYIIHKNSIGENYPSQDIKISGGHMIKYANNWILPRITNIFKQDNTIEPIKYYHIKLENYETDNLVLEGGLIVESMGETKDSLQIYKDRVKNAYFYKKNNKYIK